MSLREADGHCARQRAGEEVADDGRSFWRAVAPERRVHPARWEEDVASLLNLLQQLQAWIDVLDGRRRPQRVVQIAERFVRSIKDECFDR